MNQQYLRQWTSLQLPHNQHTSASRERYHNPGNLPIREQTTGERDHDSSNQPQDMGEIGTRRS